MSSGKVALESGALKDSRYTILCHVGLQTVSPKIQEYAKNGNLNLMKNLWNIRLWIRITSLKQSYLWLCVNQPLTHENGLWNHTLESEHQHHEVCWPLTLQFVTEQIWGLRGITGTHPWHPLHFEDIPCQKRASCDVTRDLRLSQCLPLVKHSKGLYCVFTNF